MHSELGLGAALRSFPAPKQRDRKSNRSRSVVVNGLERKYEEALGKRKSLLEASYEWETCADFDLAEVDYQGRLARIEETLSALEKAIRAFDPEWKNKRFMKPMIRRSSPLLAKGVLKSALVKIVRDAVGPLTTAEIAARVAQAVDLQMRTREQRQRLYGMTNSALKSAAREGYVACLETNPSTWVVVAPISHSEGD